MAAQQEVGSSVNNHDRKWAANLATLKAASAMLASATEEDLEELAEHSEPLEFIGEAIRSGATLREYMTWPTPSEIADMMRRCYEASISVPGWEFSRAERRDRGELVEVWTAEHIDDPDVSPVDRTRIEVEPRGNVNPSAGAPSPVVLHRALRAALGGAS